MHRGALHPKAKWPRREGDDSPSDNAEVKNAWSYISTLQASSCRGA
jgi:hypothetical protein